MRFALSDDQRLFDTMLRRFLAEQVTPARRLAAADGDGFDRDLWDGLVALGAPALLAPETVGGLGGGCLDAALMAEALGHAAAPVPSLGPLGLAPLLLAGQAAPDIQAAWFPRLIDGSARMSVVSTAPDLALRDGRLHGALPVVPEGTTATHLLIACESLGWAIVDLTLPEVRIAHRPALDPTRPPAAIHLDGAPAPIIATGAWGRMEDVGRILVAADTLGAASAMLDAAVDYARIRVQFGRPIGSFQALKHLLAEMAALLEPCRAMVWMAAQRIDDGDPAAHIIACHTKAHVADVAREVANAAIQAHGAIGFTHDLGLHLFFKRIAANRPAFGAPEQCRAWLARGDFQAI